VGVRVWPCRGLACVKREKLNGGTGDGGALAAAIVDELACACQEIGAVGCQFAGQRLLLGRGAAQFGDVADVADERRCESGPARLIQGRVLARSLRCRRVIRLMIRERRGCD
jgi:hypothetical protein